MPGVDWLQFKQTRQAMRGELQHSAKGTTWKNHKYIKKENGRYYYEFTDKPLSKSETVEAAVKEAKAKTHLDREFSSTADWKEVDLDETRAAGRGYADEIRKSNQKYYDVADGNTKFRLDAVKESLDWNVKEGHIDEDYAARQYELAIKRLEAERKQNGKVRAFNF